MKKIIELFAVAITFIAFSATAQNSEIDSMLFSESTMIYKHSFDIKLPDEVDLRVELLNLDDWQKSEVLNDLKGLAGRHIEHKRSVIESDGTKAHTLILQHYSTKDYQKINFRTRPQEQATEIFRDDEYFSLKSEKDSLLLYEILADSIMFGADDVKLPHVVKYTFTSRSLLDLGQLPATVLARTRQQLDSLVVEGKAKVRRHSANWYSTSASLNLSDAAASESKLKYSRGFRTFTSDIRLGVGFGATLFSNAFSPSLEMSLGYITQKRSRSATFVGLTYSTFGKFWQDDNSEKIGYIPVFLEFGSVRNKVGLMQSKTSVGYGVVFKSIGEQMYYLPGLQLNFAISNTISTSLIMASEWRKNAEHHIWAVGLKYNL